MNLKFVATDGNVKELHNVGNMGIAGDQWDAARLAAVKIAEEMLQQHPDAKVRFISNKTVRLYENFAKDHTSVECTVLDTEPLLIVLAPLFVELQRRKNMTRNNTGACEEQPLVTFIDVPMFDVAMGVLADAYNYLSGFAGVTKVYLHVIGALSNTQRLCNTKINVEALNPSRTEYLMRIRNINQPIVESRFSIK